MIFIGLDGADWSLLDRYIARRDADACPPRPEGASGTLKTIHPPLSPLIWTTMMTGRARSIIGSWTSCASIRSATSANRSRATSAKCRRSGTWRPRAGKKVGALGFWATYPAEAVNGLMVSDRLFTFLFSESAPPPGVVYPVCGRVVGRGRIDARANRGGLRRDSRPSCRGSIRRSIAKAQAVTDPVRASGKRAAADPDRDARLRRTAAATGSAREHPDLMLLYFQGTDSIGHVFAPYAPPRQPSIVQADYERYRTLPSGTSPASIAAGEIRRARADQPAACWCSPPTTGSSGAKDGRRRFRASRTRRPRGGTRENGIYLIWGLASRRRAVMAQAERRPGVRHAAGARRPAAGRVSRRTRSCREHP